MELKTFLCMTMFMALPSLSYSKQTPLQRRFSTLEDIVHRMEGVINEQSHKIKNLEKVNDDQSEQLKAFQEESKTQREKMTILGEENKNQSIQITNLNFDFKADDAGAEVDFTPGTYMRGASGCLSETITLTCPAGQTILMDKAEYGEYSRGCASTCCTPHPYDCVESMETSNPNEWLTLQLVCDNQESCTYLFQGSTFVGACTIANAVDYVYLFYTCLPVSSTEPVGFTSYMRNDKAYDINELLIFDGIISNFGEYYSPDTGIFICPVNGIYIFGLDIMTNRLDVSGQIMRGSSGMSTAWSEAVNNSYQKGCTTSIFECNTGEQIWVRSAHDSSSMQGDDYKHSTFFGYLLYRQ